MGNVASVKVQITAHVYLAILAIRGWTGVWTQYMAIINWSDQTSAIGALNMYQVSLIDYMDLDVHRPKKGC